MKFSSHRRNRSLSLMLGAGCLVAVCVGCEKDEAPPPLPAPKAAEPKKVEELQIPDAGPDEEDEKPKSGKGKRRPGALAACCAALRQNAQSAPAATKGHMLTAAAACDAANKRGAPAAGFLSALSGLLRGAGAPASCR